MLKKALGLTKQDVLERRHGVLFGMAYGDALAAPVEFKTVEAIVAKYGKGGPKEPAGNPARVTDDTQMGIAVGYAITDARANGGLTPANLEKTLRSRFVAWMVSPENNRAPGNTCMAACRNLQNGMVWQEATQIKSKGCGANMRVAPVALVEGLNNTERAAIAQFQAALTHGHPAALASADITMYAIWALATDVRDMDGVTLLACLKAYALANIGVYHAEWLGDLYKYAGYGSGTAYITAGWSVILDKIYELEKALKANDKQTDPCLQTGAAWIAEEAFATSLLCYLLFPGNSPLALRRAAVTSGDSDSIACLTGCYAGAAHGMETWPNEWNSRIEYRNELRELAESL